MKQEQVRDYVCRYLEATECHVLESSPAYITVKLSPEADKALTNRPYYWSFVERTGAEPETMSLTFVFDQEAFEALQAEGQTTQKPLQNGPAAATAPGVLGQDSILARYFGHLQAAPLQRTRHEPVTFGSARLHQIFASSRDKGRFVNLYEQPDERLVLPGRPLSYRSYLGVNYKVEYLCDLKRDELYSLGICLATGEILTGFYPLLKQYRLSPRLPAHTHLKEMLSLPRAVAELEYYLEGIVRNQDHQWAVEAEQRMYDELDRIKHYYQEMIQNSNEETKPAVQEEYRARQDEIAWQYKPRVLVSVINCGLFHLLTPPERVRTMANPQ